MSSTEILQINVFFFVLCSKPLIKILQELLTSVMIMKSPKKLWKDQSISRLGYSLFRKYFKSIPVTLIVSTKNPLRHYKTSLTFVLGPHLQSINSY